VQPSSERDENSAVSISHLANWSNQQGKGVRLFEPVAVYAAHVAGRCVIYLDHNIWIDLRDAASAEARECLGLCFASRDKAVFPVSHAAIAELMLVPRSDDREKQAALMDELSGGISFRVSPSILAVEAAAAYRLLFYDEAPTRDRSSFFPTSPITSATATSWYRPR